MKNRFKLIFIILIALVVISGCSGEDIDTQPRDGFEGAVYEEGIHFKYLDERIEILDSDVTVFFWFQCPHCNTIREPMAKWLSDNPGVTSEKIHSLISKSWIQDQMLYQALKKRGIFTEAFNPMFDHIHGGSGEKKGIKDILQSAGVNVDDTTFVFTEQEKKDMMSNVEIIADAERKIGALGVPYLVVKGRYLIKNSAFSSYDEMFHAVGWILENK